ncbi:MAG: hypothetical protein U0670_00530 [Anaerolineae bacterium]
MGAGLKAGRGGVLSGGREGANGLAPDGADFISEVDLLSSVRGEVVGIGAVGDVGVAAFDAGRTGFTGPAGRGSAGLSDGLSALGCFSRRV